MTREQLIHSELGNIVRNAPLWPGSTISHETANECVARGWAMRDDDGNFIPTEVGRQVEHGQRDG